ncbi:hypothetical protein [Nocardia miyunensis]|uniref:hypothetical protein n=1 Tax=Nocardia miyunensis TaxID=282684 RepID=UPI00082B1887|nr:hypothetical protein [Nocardia miyunensis]
MIKGVLIAESFLPGTKIEGVPLTITGFYRVEIKDAADYQPSLWTIIYFQASEPDADQITDLLAASLDAPGWYVDMHTDSLVYVIFPNKVFRYMPGDHDARAEAVAYARTVGVPDTQLWGETDDFVDPALT